jgi:transcriptional regulator with XRE-family HTH domain
MPTTDTDLGMRLRIERIRKRLRQRDVAIRADLSASTLSDIECGWRAPTKEQVAAICSAMGIALADVGGGDDR